MQEFEMRKTVKQISKRVGMGIVAVAVLLVLLIINPFVKIDAGERGVRLNLGAAQDEVRGEGLHLRIPIMQKIVKMDVKIQKSETRSEAASKDLQDIKSVIALNYHIVPDKANWVNQNIGGESKQEAEQFALRAQRDRERIKIEAEQKVAQAKAEAESLRLQKGQITKEMIEIRKIEAMRGAIAQWKGNA